MIGDPLDPAKAKVARDASGLVVESSETATPGSVAVAGIHPPLESLETSLLSLQGAHCRPEDSASVLVEAELVDEEEIRRRAREDVLSAAVSAKILSDQDVIQLQSGRKRRRWALVASLSAAVLLTLGLGLGLGLTKRSSSVQTLSVDPFDNNTVCAVAADILLNALYNGDMTNATQAAPETIHIDNSTLASVTGYRRWYRVGDAAGMYLNIEYCFNVHVVELQLYQGDQCPTGTIYEMNLVDPSRAEEVPSPVPGQGWTCYRQGFATELSVQYSLVLESAVNGPSTAFAFKFVSNDRCSHAYPVSLSLDSGIELTTTSQARNQSVATSCGTTTADSLWYSVNGTGQTMLASTCQDPTTSQAEVTVYRGDCASLTDYSLECIERETDPCGHGRSFGWQSESNTTYYVRVQSLLPTPYRLTLD